VAEALQLTTVLAETLFQDRYSACRPSALRSTLFGHLNTMNSNRLYLPVHGQVMLLWIFAAYKARVTAQL